MNISTLKNRIWKNTILFILSVFVLLSQSYAAGPEGLPESVPTNQGAPVMEKGIYVIVGAFQISENAVLYAQNTTIDGKAPKVGKYQKNGMYYVYDLFTKDDLEAARAKRSKLRATKKFFDAWILYVGISLAELEKEPVEEIEDTPDVIAINQPKELKPTEMQTTPKAKDNVPPPPVSRDQNTYNFRFNVISATTLKEVPGYVTIIDATRNKAMKSVSTNQIHPLEAPVTQSKEIIALCDIFGFVKEQTKFKIDDPMSSEDKAMMTEEGGITTIRYQLQRHKVGDILTMYNVYFYTDAAIMKPESKFELNSLLGMLKENENLMIRIHGHTNGNDAGKIIKMKPDSKNYFEVTPDCINGFGSAKELSQARADIIRLWLLEQGISEDRMEIKAWGGQKMMYKKTDAMAGKNVRVEIEILKE